MESQGNQNSVEINDIRTEIPCFKGKRVILGISGGIAAYKTAMLASMLTKAGVLVDVVMTEAATRFVSPMTFHSLTGRPVHDSLWDGPAAGQTIHIPHVGLAHGADLLVLAPATANTLAKLAHGIADNKLTTIFLSARCPLLVVPAMDIGMWDNVATRENKEILLRRGIHIFGPAEGRMASGLSGTGRMEEPDDIFRHIRYLLSRNGPLKGKKILVSAGPTREYMDPFRFISNPSTGTQGYSIAQAAMDLGAEVTIVSGPVQLRPPHGAICISVESATDMKKVMEKESAEADAIYMTAAVADFRPTKKADRKIKRNDTATSGSMIDLTENPDILKELGKKKAKEGLRALLVGFAAETNDVEAYAVEKLAHKNMDWVVANKIGTGDSGFGTGTNKVTIISRGGRHHVLKKNDKYFIAKEIIEVTLGIVQDADRG